MQVKQFTNSILSSNSYLLFTEEEDIAWVVDPGDSQPIINWLQLYKKTIKGILLTHYHIDHIYGVNELYEVFPKLKIYASELSLVGLYSPKLNSSYHMEMPYVVDCKEIQIVEADSQIILFNSEKKAIVIYTPGHNNDCISYKIGKYLFTGDALIPGFKVNTKSKHSNKISANESIKKLLSLSNLDTIICPGPGNLCELSTIKNSPSKIKYHNFA